MDGATAAEEAHAADDRRSDGLEQQRAAADAAAGEDADAECAEAAMTPASAAIPPAMAKAAILIRGTLTPARRAASSLFPTA